MCHQFQNEKTFTNVVLKQLNITVSCLNWVYIYKIGLQVTTFSVVFFFFAIVFVQY